MEQPTRVTEGSQGSSRLKRALVVACVQQIIIVAFAALFLLDGGLTLLKCLYAFPAYWVGFAMLMIRRRTTLTGFDRAFVEAGYFALCLFSILFAPLIWHLRGVHVG